MAVLLASQVLERMLVGEGEVHALPLLVLFPLILAQESYKAAPAAAVAAAAAAAAVVVVVVVMSLSLVVVVVGMRKATRQTAAATKGIGHVLLLRPTHSLAEK